jgi:hypothetical protein
VSVQLCTQKLKQMWFILQARQVVEVDEVQWRRWFIDNAHELVLARQEFWQQGSVVTTMFLGVPISTSDPHALFLTRVDGQTDIPGRAYHTYMDAMKGHLNVCEELILSRA